VAERSLVGAGKLLEGRLAISSSVDPSVISIEGWNSGTRLHSIIQPTKHTHNPQYPIYSQQTYETIPVYSSHSRDVPYPTSTLHASVVIH